MQSSVTSFPASAQNIGTPGAVMAGPFSIHAATVGGFSIG
jgi:hypothetical protein